MKTLHSLRAFSLFYTSSKFHCIISSHSCIFRWYNAIILNLRQNSNISVRSAGDQSILGVLPAITQHRTAASGFWEIPGASWPAARMIRPIPAADAPSGPPTQFPFLTRSLCDLRVALSYLRGLDLVCRKIPAAASMSASICACIICLT